MNDQTTLDYVPRPRDYFDGMAAQERIAIAERFVLPEPDMDEIGPNWGRRGIGVICAGGRTEMRKVASKRRADALRHIGPRLPIWC